MRKTHESLAAAQARLQGLPKVGDARPCPACGTGLTPTRGRRVGTVLWWCWKCEAYRR